jgi:hypothetical protein
MDETKSKITLPVDATVRILRPFAALHERLP